MAADGSLCVAHASLAAVFVFAPSSEPRWRVVSCAGKTVTNLAFGGSAGARPHPRIGDGLDSPSGAARRGEGCLILTRAVGATAIGLPGGRGAVPNQLRETRSYLAQSGGVLEGSGQFSS